MEQHSTPYAGWSLSALTGEWLRLEPMHCATRYAAKCFDEVTEELDRRGFRMSELEGK